MFWLNHTIDKQHKMAMMQGIKITSKEAVKIQSLMMSGGDIRQAKEIYDFLVDGMENLPDHDPIPTTWMDSTKNTVNGIVGWVQENQGAITTSIDYIRSLFGRAPVQAAAEAEEAATELQDIN